MVIRRLSFSTCSRQLRRSISSNRFKLKANKTNIETFILQSMYTCEHGASNLVQEAIFKSSEIHVNIKLKSYTTTTCVK